MTKYKFKAKELKTGEYVEGDLAYVTQFNYRNHIGIIKPMILTHACHGGMVWVNCRHYIDETTIELITKEE